MPLVLRHAIGNPAHLQSCVVPMNDSPIRSLILIHLSLVLGSIAAPAISPQFDERQIKANLIVPFQGTAAHSPTGPQRSSQGLPADEQPPA